MFDLDLDLLLDWLDVLQKPYFIYEVLSCTAIGVDVEEYQLNFIFSGGFLCDMFKTDKGECGSYGF